jgi:RNA polymerase sigma-70 factor (ECF subfamily)
MPNMTGGGDRGGSRGGTPPLRVLRGGLPASEGGPAGAGSTPDAARDSADAALLHDFLQGDDEAFEALVRRHEELVLRIVRRFTRDADDARDLAQRTFVRAFEAARRTFERTGDRTGDREGSSAVPFRRWVIRIAVNLAKNHARDSARWTIVAADDRGGRAAEAVPSSAGGPLSSLLDAERTARVRRAVLRLPRRQREVVALRLDAELSFAEIGAALEIEEGAARVAFHHATVRLRELVGSDEEGGRTP